MTLAAVMIALLVLSAHAAEIPDRPPDPDGKAADMTLLVDGNRQKIAVNQRLPLDPCSRFPTLTTLDLQAGQNITIQFGNEGTDALQLTKHRQAATKKLPIKGEVFSIKDRTAFLILPEKPQAGRPIPWVWYAPTLPGLPGGAEKWMFEEFLENGIAIAGVDVGESYGSPAGRAVYTALHDELVKKRGLDGQACLLTRSRGGLMLYCWAVENPDKVKCITGIYPVCNIASYPGLDRACGAYGLTAEQLKEVLVKHNPIDRLTPLARAKVPIFHIHGDQDQVVPLEANSGLVKKRYDQLGGEMTLEIVRGQGHNLWAGWFNSQKLVDFILTNAAR